MMGLQGFVVQGAPWVSTARWSRRKTTVCSATPFTAGKPKEVSEAAKATKRFSSWLEDAGMYLEPRSDWGRPPHGLVIADETTDDSEPSGRGLLAAKPIGQNECLYEVPESVILTKKVALTKFDLPADIDEYHSIAILIIHETSLGNDSFYKPYFDVLPKDEELNPLFRWPDEDLELLEGSPALPAAASLKAKLKAEFDDTERTIFSKNRREFPEDVFTFERWEWAFAVLFSRAISLQETDTLALVPYADLINHNPYCSTFIDMHKGSWFKEGVVVQYSDRQYEKTQQVFSTYGPKSNSELLLLYGFVSDRNPYDCVDLTVSLDPENDPLYDEKCQFLKDCYRPTSVTFPLYADRYPKELIEFLRFCCANKAEMEEDFGEFISERNEQEVVNYLISACKSALSRYPQTMEDDIALMKDRALYKLLSQNKRWSLKQRRNEKRILTRAIANVERERADPSFVFSGFSGG